MDWKTRILTWALISIPAFTGYPLHYFHLEIVPGINAGWLGYSLLMHAVIFRMTGHGRYLWMLTLTVWITLPVVFGGALISSLVNLSRLNDMSFVAVRGAHYLRLCITMMTVVPLAMSLFAIIPFGQIEQRLLFRKAGLSRRHVRLLMFLRVFTHILYSVIPNILEVLREEGMIRNRIHNPVLQTTGLPFHQRCRIYVHRTGLWIGYMQHVVIACICASLQYIPLWAVELSLLSGYQPVDGHFNNRLRSETDEPSK
jgi:hypothetical protein